MNSCRSIVLLQRQVQLGIWVVRRSDQVGDGSRVGIFNSNIESKKKYFHPALTEQLFIFLTSRTPVGDANGVFSSHPTRKCKKNVQLNVSTDRCM